MPKLAPPIADQLATRDPFKPRPLRLPPSAPSAFTAPLITIDIPAEFKCWSGKGQTNRAAATKYKLMTWEELVGLGPLIRRIASRRGCTFLPWVFPPTRRYQEHLFDLWGLNYTTTAFAWVKLDKKSPMSAFLGMGHHTRANTELVDLWKVGRPERHDKGTSQILMSLEKLAPEIPTLFDEVGEHSEKPPIFYESCETLWAGPRVEMFSRRSREGWLTIGFDVDGMDIRESLTLLAEGKYPIPEHAADPPLRLGRLNKLRKLEAETNAAQMLLWS